MPETSRGTFGGLPLTDKADHAWEQTSGVSPGLMRCLFSSQLADRVLGLIGRVTSLVLERAEGGKIEVKNLWAIREIPVQLPFHCGLLVADVRWRWPRRLHVRSYNITRRTGSKYIVGGSVVELQQSIDEYGYAPFSEIKRTKRWSPRETIVDVLKGVLRGDAEVVVDSMPLNDGVTDRSVTVQDLDCADSGDQAVARALRLIPGTDVYAGADGKIHVYDATDQAIGQAQLRKLGPPTDLGNIPKLIRLGAMRPSKIRVFFEREVELRFDTVEETESHYADPKNAAPPMRSFNVMPLPDIEATIGGKRYATGSWVDFRDIVPVWNQDLSSLGDVAPLTLEKIRKRWFHLEGFYSPLGDLTLTAALLNWASRCAAIKSHYRRTFRIPPGWMAVIRDLKDWRVGVLDPVTAARGYATCWSQFCIVPSQKFRKVHAKDPSKQYYWINADSYPGFDSDLEAKSASPAVVRILDPHVGIYTLDYRTDPQGMREVVHPSQVVDSSASPMVPTRDLSDVRGPFGPNWITKGGVPIGLSPSFYAAVILTAIAGAPNSSSRLHYVDVEAKDLGDAFKASFAQAPGTGPVWEIYCPPSIMTAWLAWRSTAQARETAGRLFGLSGALAEEEDGKGQGGGAATKYPGYEVLNEQILLPAVARAVAAVKYAEFADAWEGAPAGTLAPDAHPAGNVATVRHALSATGVGSTSFSMPMARHPLDFMAAIPQALRHRVLGLLEDR